VNGNLGWHDSRHGTTMQRVAVLFVPGGVIFFLELIEVDSDLVTQGRELLVALLLQRAQLLVLQGDGVVDRGEVVQDDELLQVRHKLH